MQLGNSLNFKRLTVQTGFNYSARYNQLSEGLGVPDYNYSPEALANINYRFTNRKINLAIFYKYTGKLPGYAQVNDEILQTFISDYHTMDATLSWQLAKDRITLTAGCKNIFDVKSINSAAATSGAHNTSSASIPVSTGRNYFFKLSLSLSRK